MKMRCHEVVRAGNAYNEEVMGGTAVVAGCGVVMHGRVAWWKEESSS